MTDSNFMTPYWLLRSVQYIREGAGKGFAIFVRDRSPIRTLKIVIRTSFSHVYLDNGYNF